MKTENRMRVAALLFAGVALCACTAVEAADKAVPADNTGINQRDRSDRTLTPENQSESKSDIELAATVRRAVVAQKGISIAGQNIKIITQDGAITLRGPVKSPAERASIEKTVRKVAGNATVDNQLEIK